ncbi:Protein LEO1-like protein [Abeliophyllum distichum]|uniref:Protein LEO1-like protein n=1 Tax=Abeliophyllum distichum TaxID=126358 RepID=A0ABD1VTW9_9LAMI
MVRGEKFNQIMQSLFGYQSEEEEFESQDEPNCQSNSANNKENGGLMTEGDDKSSGQGKVDPQSDGEPDDVGHIHGVSKLKNPRSQVVCIGDKRGSEGSRSPGDRKDNHQNLRLAAAIRDVFGDSDDEDQAGYTVQNQIDDKETRPVAGKKRYYEKERRPGNILADEEVQYEPEKENAEAKPEKKVAVPSLVLKVSKRHPPADPDNTYLVRLPNIVGIDPRPFDPSTYVEQDFFATDNSGSRKRIPSKNIIRWRHVKNPNGTISVESNSRFVSWSDDSLQLYIGEESFDVSEQDARDIEMHLFLKTEEGILQSQGRITKRMQFMPSSLTSDSHRTLSAVVAARHKKVNKVKNCIADVDPEREVKYKEKGLKHPHKLAIPTAGSSRWPIALSESKRKDSRYKSGKKEYEGSSSQRSEDTKQNSEEEHDNEQQEEACKDAEVEAEEAKKKKAIESDKEYLPGKATISRRKTINRWKTTVYVSDEE